MKAEQKFPSPIKHRNVCFNSCIWYMSTYILRKFNWKFLINTRNILFAIFRSFKHRRVCFNISRYNFLRRNVKSFATYNVIANDASTRISRNVRIIRLQPRVSHVNPRNDATRFFKIHISARIRFLAGAREARLSLSLLLHSSPSAHDATNFLQFIRPLAGWIGWKAVGNKVAERTSRLPLDRSSEFIEFQMESRIRAEHENVASAKPKYCFEGC